MGIEQLTPLEIIEGSTSLIYAVFGTIIGLTIASKYISHKRQELLWVGLSLAFVSAPWYGGGISFLTFIFFNQVLPDTVQLFINYGLISIAMVCWIYGISILVFPRSTKKLVLIYFLICASYEIFLIIFLFTNPSMVGERESKFSTTAALIPTVFVIFALISTLITMIMFIRDCFRSENPITIWRGRFLLIALLLLVTGSLMDAVLPLLEITLIISRSILIIRLVLSYIGWLMPKKVANWLIKENK